jgi:CubicO group peptidase (beta-lactamase class C family)
MKSKPDVVVRPALVLPALVLVAALNACAGDTTTLITPTPADTTPSLSAIVDTIRRAWKLPAMGAAIVTLDEGVTAVAVAGTRRATGGPAVTTDDLWHLGSNTKAITALVAAVAVSENRIQWTTTVAQAFPEVTNIRPEYREVTLRDLLSHQSGFPRDVNVGFSDTTPPRDQRALAATWALQQPPAVVRGTFSYSNLGYITAGAMLDRAFGTPYEDAVRGRVYAPLGITDAGWGPQAAAGSATQPVPHTWTSSTWVAREAFDIPPINNPSGRVHISLASWGRVLREVLRVEAGAPTIAPASVAGQTTLAAVTVNATTSYGMGWLISTRTWADGRILFHDGSNTANHSMAVVAPMRKVAFLATTNAFDTGGGQTTKALDALILRLNVFHSTGR